MKLEVQDLRKKFGGFEALRGVSFSIPSGKTLALLGPSGCGKTTTLRVIAGLLKPDSGRILFDGEDVTELPPRQRNIGMVFQSPALFPNFTVRENIAFPLEARGKKPEEISRRVKEVTEMVELSGLEERRPHELSRGQQQRVAIGRAIASEVKLLLLDEPLTALDAGLRAEISSTIRMIQRKLGITTIYVTHDQLEAFAMGDFIATMFDGTIDAYADAQTMYAKPPTEKTARFLGFVNRLETSAEHLDPETIRLVFPGGEFKMKWHGSKTAGKVAVLFRPEDASISLEGEGLLDGELSSSMFAGRNTVTRVKTSQGMIECAGNDSSQYQAISGMAGRKVTVKIDLNKALLIETGKT
ncbi:MAG: ABC transporter ATP-binding protein [Thermoproteota archaeon]|nr:ABC transporter ATP-binding protein [Candidatus Brockarchaeota archaeon]